MRAANLLCKISFLHFGTSTREFARLFPFYPRLRPNQLAVDINANCRVCKLHVCISTYCDSYGMVFTKDEYGNSPSPALTSKNNFNIIFLFLFNFLASADNLRDKDHSLTMLMAKPNKRYPKLTLDSRLPT